MTTHTKTRNYYYDGDMDHQTRGGSQARRAHKQNLLKNKLTAIAMIAASIPLAKMDPQEGGLLVVMALIFGTYMFFSKKDFYAW